MSYKTESCMNDCVKLLYQRTEKREMNQPTRVQCAESVSETEPLSLEE